MNRGFVSAKIRKMKELYVVTINWSWYHITTWSEVEIFETLEEAKTHILNNRCAGGLSIEI